MWQGSRVSSTSPNTRQATAQLSTATSLLEQKRQSFFTKYTFTSPLQPHPPCAGAGCEAFARAGDPRKDACPDGMTGRVLKEFENQFSEVITKIIPIPCQSAPYP